MNLKRLQQILAARFSQIHVQRVKAADQTADKVDIVMQQTIDKIVNIAMSSTVKTVDKIWKASTTLGNAFPKIVDKLRPHMEKLFQWSAQESALIFVQELPRSWLGAKIRQAQRAMQVEEVPLDRIHEMPKDQYEKLVKRYVLPPRTKADAEATMTRRVITVNAKAERIDMNWEERIRDLSKLVDPVKVAKEVVEAAEAGESAHQLARRLVKETRGVGASARRIARTENMRQMEDAAGQTYQQLGDIYIGKQYLATLDERVRPEHAILHGKIWWVNGNKPDISEMPVPPIQANCRCGSSPVTSPPREALEDPKWLAAARDAAQTAHPDVATQDEWFKQADEDRRRISVGAKRYDAMAKTLGTTRQPEWIDFVAKDGRLMTLKELQSESSAERAKRRAEILVELQIQAAQAKQVGTLGFMLPK